MFDQKEIERVRSLIENIRGGNQELERLKASIVEADGGSTDPIVVNDWVDSALVICHRNIIATKGNQPDEAMSHDLMKEVWKESFKLSGLTPYEAAAIYQESKGEFPIGSSAKDIFRKKRCDELPTEFSPKADDEKNGILRAILMRPMVTQRFQNQYANLGLKPCPKSSDALMKVAKNPPKDKPWLRPSFGFDIMLDATGKRYLINYKTPASVDAAKKYETDGVPDSDKATFAYTKEILKLSGIEVDVCGLVVMDNFMQINLYKVDGIDEMAPQIFDACEKFWDGNVRSGLTPKREKSKNFKAVKDVPPNLYAKVARLIAAAEMKNQGTTHHTALKDDILEEISRAGVDLDEIIHGEDYDPSEVSKQTFMEKLTGKAQVGGLGITKALEPVLDAGELEQAFLAQGGSPEEIYDKKLNTKALVDAAKVKGMDLSPYYSNKASYRFDVSRSKTNVMRSMIDEIKSVLEETIGDTMNEVTDMIEEEVGHIPRIKEAEKIEAPDEDFNNLIKAGKAPEKTAKGPEKGEKSKEPDFPF